MKKYTIIGTYSGGENYFECVEAENVNKALKSVFNPSQDEESPPEQIIAVIAGHHEEIGLSKLGFLYPITEHDQDGFEA